MSEKKEYGMTDCEIAELLGVTQQTVQITRTRAMSKMITKAKEVGIYDDLKRILVKLS
jgi:FixJ family two-component response regulator